MTKESLSLLEGLKYAQVIEDGMVYLDLARQLAVSANENGPCLEFDISPYDTCIGSILAALGEEGLISPWAHDVGYYHVTHKGWHYHAKLEQERKLHAQQEAQQKANEAKAVKDKRKDRQHDYFVALFGAVMGSLLTLLVEHSDKLVAFVIDFLH